MNEKNIDEEYEKFMDKEIDTDFAGKRLYENQFTRKLSDDEVKTKQFVEEFNNPKLKQKMDVRMHGFENTIDLHIEIENNKAGASGEEMRQKAMDMEINTMMVLRGFGALAFMGFATLVMFVLDTKVKAWAARDKMVKLAEEQLDQE